MTNYASLVFDFSPVLDTSLVYNADDIDFENQNPTVKFTSM
jgi:hypothetical protein